MCFLKDFPIACGMAGEFVSSFIHSEIIDMPMRLRDDENKKKKKKRGTLELITSADIII